MHVRWTLASIALLFPVTLPAQVLPPDEGKAMTIAEIERDKLHYLEVERILRPFAVGPDGKPKDSFARQSWAEAVAWMTGQRPVEPITDTGDPVALARIAAAEPQDAIAAIVERARTTSVVFLNEAHGVPRSRAFALQVAEALRPLGYSILAVETLDNSGGSAKADARLDRIAANGYVESGDGYYLRDPVFADFLRQAIARGYRLASYEQTPDQRGSRDSREMSIAKREQAQADYLLNRVVNRFPGRKVLVYVGYSHATEAAQPDTGTGELRWLATRFKAMTGIDPLTIDQTTLMLDGRAEDATPLARAASAKVTGDRSAILIAAGKPLIVGLYAGLVDLQVVHPALPDRDGRPGWLAAAMHRTPTSIPIDLLPKSGRRLVQAFVVGEGTGTMPVDQVLVEAGKPVPMLLLPMVPTRWAVQQPEVIKIDSH